MVYLLIFIDNIDATVPNYCLFTIGHQVGLVNRNNLYHPQNQSMAGSREGGGQIYPLIHLFDNKNDYMVIITKIYIYFLSFLKSRPPPLAKPSYGL